MNNLKFLLKIKLKFKNNSKESAKKLTTSDQESLFSDLGSDSEVGSVFSDLHSSELDDDEYFMEKRKYSLLAEIFKMTWFPLRHFCVDHI